MHEGVPGWKRRRRGARGDVRVVRSVGGWGRAYAFGTGSDTTVVDGTATSRG